MTDAEMTNLEAAVAPVILRSRKSEWPAISMVEALSVVEQAFKKALTSLQHVRTAVAPENVELGDVLAKDILAKSPHPPFRASIKDGYAVLASDGAGPRKVIGSSTADKNTTSLKLYPGVCCRINTGAGLPDGADAVVQVEDTILLEHNNIEETMIMIAKEPRTKQDIREIGSDVALGELLLEAGMPFQPADIGLLALSNSSEVDVYQAAKVSVLSTGDELTDQLIEGDGKAIRDTNRPVLLSLFQSIGAQVHDMGIALDNKDAIVTAIQKAFQETNILVVTGGVSMGEKDLLKQILTQHFKFQIHFGRVFMKPGLPTTFATGVFEGHPKFVFGLPGNPVSGFVTAHLFVCPVLKLVSGVKRYKSTRMMTTEDIKLDPRPEYRRACLVPKATEVPEVECLAGSQISSRLLSLRSANVLLELPGLTAEKQMVYKGEVVEALVIGTF